ncbi:MAG: Rrf2 family transcriptional regulator [Ignavibacteriaceae bacterium]|nr:Rrf2 family transcriptional regulator [Ignavibacteriaceae bacterium]
MSASTKLSTSVKALCYLEQSYPKPVSSSEIASVIRINSSKLRMILSMLAKNGIVESNSGTAGGFKLVKSASDIHLQEIYCAIEDRKAFHLDVRKDSIKKNSLPEKLNSYFLDMFAEVQVDIEDKMKKITLESIINKIKTYK